MIQVGRGKERTAARGVAVTAGMMVVGLAVLLAVGFSLRNSLNAGASDVVVESEPLAPTGGEIALMVALVLGGLLVVVGVVAIAARRAGLTGTHVDVGAGALSDVDLSAPLLVEASEDERASFQARLLKEAASGGGTDPVGGGDEHDTKD